MLVGIDVSHAEIGSDRESVAAVVGSMDGRLCQYAAQISLQPSRVEMVQHGALQEAVKALLESFKRRNKTLPATIVVFRDGVADGQFDQVIGKELPAIKGALELMGYIHDSVKIAIVICQKSHHTRFFYQEGGSYINPCPGLVVDAVGGADSIVSARLNEFYLNSHHSLQGTAKACKYSLIYDEIGLRISEVELLTYWSTYLYARCTKSVSYATPAYYAHWASKRGRALATAGATPQNLIDISAMWSGGNKNGTMFFV